VLWQENKDAFEIETLEVELFGPDGRIKDIWMFRWGAMSGLYFNVHYSKSQHRYSPRLLQGFNGSSHVCAYIVA
jgi:hypothetical protein